MTEFTSLPEPAHPTGQLPDMAELCRLIADSTDWKAALDQILPHIRAQIIFDNLVIFQAQAQDMIGEVVYARAIGRGRTLGEDISWGDRTAALVFTSHNVVIDLPSSVDSNTNRLDLPFIIGQPIELDNEAYALILIRFGGPTYTEYEKQALDSMGSIIKLILRQKKYNDQISLLEHEREQSIGQVDLISTISHELLSPIGFIKGYTTTLLRSDTSWTPEKQQEFLSIIDDETDRLQELIDNLLDSAKLQMGTLSIESQPVRLDTLIRDVILRAEMHQTGIKIETRITQQLPQIHGDSRRLTQVFENLISNVNKYAPGSVLVIAAESAGETIHITFSDNGPGISPKYMPNLFNKFFRNPENSSEVRGTGLGLFICRQIIELHQGKIYAESELGKGTTLHILLPATPTIKQSGLNQ